MLQLQANSINIVRISNILAKYNVKSSISEHLITLDGDISDELLSQLCSGIDINAVQNFTTQEPLHKNKEYSFIKNEESIKTKIVEEPKIQPQTTSSPPLSEYDLIYSEVKRGEVYICDFGNPYGREEGLSRYAIIIQNNVGNLYSPTTIVVACTASYKKRLPVHYHCRFSSQNMVDYDLARVGSLENIIMAEQIQTIDKKRLRKYIGTLTPEFMEKLQDKIDISLGLSRKVKTTINQ